MPFPPPHPKRISPSLLAADFGRLAESACFMEDAGADSLHLDVVDGHFARNFAFGPAAVAAIRRAVDLPLVVHLEIERPDLFLEPFVEAGADAIVCHVETTPEPHRTIETMCRLGVRPGLALCPTTPVLTAEAVIEAVPLLLLLAVPPGFGGARLDQGIFHRLRQVRRIAQSRGHPLEIVVDGGVRLENAGALAAAGADTLVSGAGIFDSPDPRARIAALRRAATAAGDSVHPSPSA